MTITQRKISSPFLAPQNDTNELEVKLRAQRLKIIAQDEQYSKGPTTYALDSPCESPCQSPRSQQTSGLDDVFDITIDDCVYDLINHAPPKFVRKVTELNEQLRSKHNEALTEIASLRAQLDASISDRESLKAEMCRQQITNPVVFQDQSGASNVDQDLIHSDTQGQHSDALVEMQEGEELLEECLARNSNRVAEATEFETRCLEQQASITTQGQPQHTFPSAVVTAFWEDFRLLQEQVEELETLCNKGESDTAV